MKTNFLFNKIGVEQALSKYELKIIKVYSDDENNYIHCSFLNHVSFFTVSKRSFIIKTLEKLIIEYLGFLQKNNLNELITNIKIDGDLFITFSIDKGFFSGKYPDIENKIATLFFNGGTYFNENGKFNLLMKFNHQTNYMKEFNKSISNAELKVTKKQYHDIEDDFFAY